MRETEYGLPIDEDELDRIDMSHAKYNLVLEQELFIAPIASHPQKILDLGTGTGKSCLSDGKKVPETKSPCRNLGYRYRGKISIGRCEY